LYSLFVCHKNVLTFKGERYSLYHALGPATWCKDFPIANGKRQSPIDIVPGSVTFDAKLASAPLIIKYKTESKLEASNHQNVG
jgi:carbonic anhydrase